MVTKLVTDLHRPLSQVRLGGYRPTGGSDEEMLVNYLWNMALAEALYPSLAALEVALRNSIHGTLNAHLGSEYWFDTSGLFPVRGRYPHPQTKAIAQARDTLRDLGKEITSGRIVAELTFGFWTKMLAKVYHPLWFTNHAAALKAAFPHAEGPNLQRHLLYERYDDLRLLRNRVFHHEPIWKRPGLPQEHTQILEAIGWISPEMEVTTQLVDRFPDVFHHGRQRLGTALHRLLATRISYLS